MRLVDQGQDFLVADTFVSGFVFRTRMHWSDTDGDVFFHNAFVHGVWHMAHCTAEACSESHGADESQNGWAPCTHIQLHITIAPGLFAPILRKILEAVLPGLQRAFQKRLDDKGTLR